ncbi:hypothetical protein MHBO_000180 [Bonamia ostreae]|uniref:Uncharacterized protein n=1 Tax=Bonamia ostreae TaxID=126728 RepID=A0ABV2AEP6_9EUKA
MTKKDVHELLQQIPHLNTDIKIYFSSFYQACDSLVKFLRQLFPSIEDSYLPSKKISSLIKPLFILVPTKSPFFKGINDKTFNCFYGAGIYGFNCKDPRGVIKALTFFANGEDTVTPFIHVVKVKNAEAVFRNWKKQEKDEFVEASKPVYTSDFGVAGKERVFSFDRELTLLHPTIPETAALLANIKSCTQKLPLDLRNHSDLLSKHEKIEKTINEMATAEAEMSNLENGVKVMFGNISEKLFFDPEMTDQDILDICDIAIDMIGSQWRKFGKTLKLAKEDLEEYVKKRASRNAKRTELTRIIEQIKIILRNKIGDAFERMYEHGAIDENVQSYLEILDKLDLSNRFGIQNKTKVEAKCEVVATFEFLPCHEASHHVYSRYVGVHKELSEDLKLGNEEEIDSDD